VRVAACALLIGVFALSACAAAQHPAASVAIERGMPQPDPEDDNPLGQRIWSVYPHVVIRFRHGCGAAEYRSSATTWLNRVRASWGGGNGAETDALGRVAAGRVVTEQPQLDAYAGQAIRLTIRVSCDGGATMTTRTYRLPAASCEDGFLHVYELLGRAEWIDDRRSGRAHPLRAGDLVQSEDGVRLARGAHAVIGAAECNDLRLDLGPGKYWIGGYRSDARGEGFSGPRAVVTADAHAGAWDAGGLEVLPLDSRCSSCSTAHPSTFEVRGARVRVIAGAVLAQVPGRTVRVSAGEEAGAACTSPTRCRLLGPRIYQPAEPWSTPLDAPPPHLRSIRAARAGSPPPVRTLAPAFSQTSVYRLPAAGGAPEQLAVVWSRAYRSRPGAHGSTQQQEGLLIWQRVAPTRWRIVDRRRASVGQLLGVTIGDVTRDGHPDVLAVIGEGSGACGPRLLLAWAAGRERALLSRNECESTYRIRGGALVVDEPVGPCPYANGSAHCFGGVRHTVMRWNGPHLLARRATVACALPRLDPARACRPRR
jgi:hypothetical protein